MLDIVNEKDQFVKKATRKEVRDKALLHRVSRVLVYNKFGKLLVQKRAKTKDMFPSYWDIGIAETVKSDEGYEGAALRGLVEEAGIYGISNIQLIHSFLFKIKYNSQETNELCKVYELQYNGNIQPQKEEIEAIDFLTATEVKDLISENKFHPVGKVVFEKYLESMKIKKC